MADETQTPTACEDQPAHTADAPAASEPAAPEPSRRTNTDLSFDDAQKEIKTIRAKTSAVKSSIRSTPNISTVSRTSYKEEYDLPRSNNMLSHLTTREAILNYKAQVARALVRKQEDLLRNLALIRNNMERSEDEIGKVSDYYGGRGKKFNYTLDRAESRHQVHRETRSEVKETPAPPPKPAEPELETRFDDDMSKDFEKEINEIKQRVSELASRCQVAGDSYEVTKSAGRGGIYDCLVDDSPYSVGDGYDTQYYAF